LILLKAIYFSHARGRVRQKGKLSQEGSPIENKVTFEAILSKLRTPGRWTGGRGQGLIIQFGKRGDDRGGLEEHHSIIMPGLSSHEGRVSGRGNYEKK